MTSMSQRVRTGRTGRGPGRSAGALAAGGLAALIALSLPAGAAAAAVHAPPAPRVLDAAASARHADLAGMARVAGPGPERALHAVLRRTGRDEATLASLGAANWRDGRHGVRHVRFEQQVGGLPVHGAVLKAAFAADGRLVHLIDAFAAVPAQAAAVAATPPAVAEAAAVRIAVERLHPNLLAPIRATGRKGALATFDAGTGFDPGPTVEAVLVPVAGGALVRAWRVQTWTERTNLLHHTLVAADDGRILGVQRRTSQDQYRVFPLDPDKSAASVVRVPAPTAQSPLGWLLGAQGTADIRGNNVRAYLDADVNNRPDPVGSPVRGRSFVSAVDLGVMPDATTANREAAVQNLFFHANRLHDLLYRLGFDEPAGNFQRTNFKPGGLEGDWVDVEAHDGYTKNNASMSTPLDGAPGRMTMYLWDGPLPTHEVVLPDGTIFGAKEAGFAVDLVDGIGVTAPLVVVNPLDACTDITNALAGLHAIVKRGTCPYWNKYSDIQGLGAKGMILFNDQGGDTTVVMGGGAAPHGKIPGVMISQNDGAALLASGATTATIRQKTPRPLRRDSALDSDVIIHEYGHGLTWRMVGDMWGPLAGALGEGASDALAILINHDDAVGEYVSQLPNGVRRARYANYPYRYENVLGTSVHADGEVYAAAIWRTRELMGPGRSEDLLALFVDGMNYIPPAPTYEQMRDGLLQAVAMSERPRDRCTVWAAFAHFGIGEGSRGVVSGDTVSITPSYQVPADCR
jgi:hypothetical protein